QHNRHHHARYSAHGRCRSCLWTMASRRYHSCRVVYGAPLLAVLLLALATGHQSPLAVSSTATRDAAPSSSPCRRLCLFGNPLGVSRQGCSRCSQRYR
ncbi:unnamed protein product, partial [Ectocarpus sp. 6 AP-2014]